MKVAVKRKFAARYHADGSLKEAGEYQELTEVEEKFRARVSMQWDIITPLPEGQWKLCAPKDTLCRSRVALCRRKAAVDKHDSKTLYIQCCYVTPVW